MKLRARIIFATVGLAVISGGGGVRMLESPPAIGAAPGSSGSSSGTSRPAVTEHVVSSGSEDEFFKTVLEDLNAPATSIGVHSLEAWYGHEYTSWPPKASYNPLDSTMTEPGSTNFNTFSTGLHVQNYPDPATGAKATAATLLNGNYPQVTAALQAGKSLCGSRFAAEISKWSGGGYSAVC